MIDFIINKELFPINVKTKVFWQPKENLKLFWSVNYGSPLNDSLLVRNFNSPTKGHSDKIYWEKFQRMNRRKNLKKQESYKLSDEAVEKLYDKKGRGFTQYTR